LTNIGNMVLHYTALVHYKTHIMKGKYMMKYFEIWFNDSSRELALGIEQLKELSQRFNFDYDEVIRDGEIVLFDDSGEAIGGVQTLYNTPNLPIERKNVDSQAVRD